MNTGHQSMGERRIREAMAIPGRFKPDGCWQEVPVKYDDAFGKPTYFNNNRKFRRSGGRARQ